MLPIAVLCPFRDDDPGPPEGTALGRAALALADRIEVIFGDEVHDGEIVGQLARPGRWEPGARRPRAAYDRYPSQRLPERHRAVLDALPGIPIGNPRPLVELCRDKLACQRYVGGGMPEVVDDPALFADALAAWGAGFLKPRYGAYGVGIRRVIPGDRLPGVGQGLIGEEPLILQRAIPAPPGWAGICVRVLAQCDGDWLLADPVVRRSRTDPVVNMARGAEAAPADTLPEPTRQAIAAIALEACQRLSAHPDGRCLVELGLDLVVDDRLQPHLIEVNGRPMGRLGVLAGRDPRFAEAHLAAAIRPLLALARLAG